VSKKQQALCRWPFRVVGVADSIFGAKDDAQMQE
jgi:hypothetical protein